MKRANLIRALWNSDNPATIRKLQFQRGLFLERLGEREAALKRFVLLFVKSLGVFDQLCGLVLFLGLKSTSR